MHPDDETLAEMAVGGQLGVAERAHVEACPECSDMISSLRDTVDVLRGADDVAFSDPPEAVWSAVLAELGSVGVADLAARRKRGSDAASRPSWWRTGLAAAAVVGIIAGALGMRLLAWPTGPNEAVVAAAPLATLDTQRALGEAEVVRVNGTLSLQVSTDELRPGNGYLEVWLINRDLKRMVSVGVLPAGRASARFPISQMLLDEGYVIVDVSREPLDEKPQHSGDSLVRGALT